MMPKARLIFSMVDSLASWAESFRRESVPVVSPSFRAYARCVSPPCISRTFRCTVLAAFIQVADLTKCLSRRRDKCVTLCDADGAKRSPMRQITKKSTRRQKQKPPSLVSAVTRDGKTTIRQFHGRRFVRFGEFRGKKVAWVEFYTWESESNSISIRFQDQTVMYFRIDPMFTVRPEYYRIKAGDLETVKEWPEMRMER